MGKADKVVGYIQPKDAQLVVRNNGGRVLGTLLDIGVKIYSDFAVAMLVKYPDMSDQERIDLDFEEYKRRQTMEHEESGDRLLGTRSLAMPKTDTPLSKGRLNDPDYWLSDEDYTPPATPPVTVKVEEKEIVETTGHKPSLDTYKDTKEFEMYQDELKVMARRRLHILTMIQAQCSIPVGYFVTSTRNSAITTRKVRAVKKEASA